MDPLPRRAALLYAAIVLFFAAACPNGGRIPPAQDGFPAHTITAAAADDASDFDAESADAPDAALSAPQYAPQTAPRLAALRVAPDPISRATRSLESPPPRA